MKLQPKQFLRIKDVVRLTRVPRSTIYEMIDRDEFPKPFRITARLVAWLEDDIAAWQHKCMTQRETTRSV